MWNKIIIFGAICGFIALAAGTWYQHDYCSNLQKAEQKPEPSSNETTKTQNQATQEHLISGGTRSTININAPLINQKYSPQFIQNPKRNWGEAFICEAKATDVALVWFTLFLVIFTGLLYLVGRNAEEATRTIERAYVQMSHVSNAQIPGLRVNATSGECGASISIKNYGTTPARITRIFLTKRVLASKLSDFPEYQSGSGELPELPIEAFLMKDAEVFVGLTFTIDVADISLIAEKKKQLVVYGFVDYSDQFGRDFRAGYARNWAPELTANNLIFVPHPRYNYDRKRKPGQGNEWA